VFRIGDFSRIARVSARLLRFYDEIGLLRPAHADPQTGYRYYTVAQLAQLNRILVLKDLGFNLDQVRDIVGSNVSPSELRNMLLLRRNDVEQTIAAEAQRLRQIETRITQIESDGELSADDVAVAHAPHFEQDELDVEFGFTLDESPELPRGSPLALRELEAVERMAVCVRVGLPEDAHLVTAKIGRFLEAGGDALAGPSREVFLQLPDPERMHEAVVEMQFPIAPDPAQNRRRSLS